MNLHSSLRVELHTWTDGTPQHVQGVIDVTRFVVSASWTDSLLAPWTSINLQLAVPFRMIRDIIPGRKVDHGRNLGSNTNQLPETDVTIDTRYGYIPEPGFWVVIRNMSEDVRWYSMDKRTLSDPVALAFGRCHSVSFGVMARQGDGNTVTVPVAIQAESFLAFTGRSQMQFAPQGKGSWGMDGFVWDIGSWNDSMQAVLKSILQPYPGQLLSKLWGSVVRLETPPSLGVVTLGVTAYVVHDEATAAKYAPMRSGTVEAVMGGMQLPSVGALQPNHPSLLNFFLTTFYANHEAVEFFSSLEYPAKNVEADLNSLGVALGGAQPVIVYRLKPWIMEAINSDAVMRTSEAKDKAAAAAKLTMDRVGIGKRASRTAGAHGVQWFDWARDEVVSVQMGWNDSNRVNLTFGNWCGAALDDPAHYGLTGTPIVPDTTTIKRHGLRSYAMRWPFFQKGGESDVGKAAGVVADAATAAAIAAAATGFPGASAAASTVAQVAKAVQKITMPDYHNSIIELAWMMSGDGQRWCSGSLGGLYKPQVKPGHWGKVDFHDATLTFYIEAVSHSVTVDQSSGHVRKDTTVRFSRGTLRHQDSPSYQFRLETRGSNPEGAPVNLILAAERGGLAGLFREGRDEATAALLKLQEKVEKAAKPIAGGQAVLYIPNVPLLRYSKQSPATKPDGSPLKYCIVVHITAGRTISAMLKEFNEQRITDAGTTYTTSTHYSVDKDGVIIQWLDPKKYVANHSQGGVATQSVGIDVIARSEDTGNLPEAQKRALAILIQYIRGMFPDIPNTVSTPNTYYVGADGTSYEKLPGGLPPKDALKYSLVRKAGTSLYTIADVKKNKWGICRHRDFWKKACPALVPLEELVALQINTGSLKITTMGADQQKELETLAKAAGVL